MGLIDKLKPRFWDHDEAQAGPYRHHFDFRQIWKRSILVTATVALAPLIIWAVAGYRLNQDTIESELVLRTSQLIKNSWRSTSLFLSERLSVLDFIAHDHDLETLNDPARLAAILHNLNKRFGGFTDLGVIDSSGRQQTYVGSYPLAGLDYNRQPWFQEVLKRGVYISDLVLGFRNKLHINFAVRRNLPNGSFFVVRAALEPEHFNEFIARFEVGKMGDAFVINQEGILQTPSRHFGPALNKIQLRVPEYSPQARVIVHRNEKNEPIVIGYEYIPETPYILMIVEEKGELIEPWYKLSWAFTGILFVSILLILLVSLAVSTYLVGQIHAADQERVNTLHQVEYASKMVSLGRLAAGVAHEINNPLAIINEKAGHIRDIFILTETYAKDPKLIDLVDSVISTVRRCADVTKGLMDFARHLSVSVQTINLREIVDEVKSILAKETEFRSISVEVNLSDEIPPFESDRGKLEQIFFNLFNNAIASMKDGGRLEITSKHENAEFVVVTFADSGPGIPKSDLKYVFEPFFYLQALESGTGLGLSVTYALVQEIGGQISVQSELGQGTRFDIRLPLKVPVGEQQNTREFNSGDASTNN